MSETNERSVGSDGSVAMSQRAIAELETAIRRLAEQDATLSVQGGNVTVTMDATLTDAERDAVLNAIQLCEDITYGGAADQWSADVLRALLERTK